MTPTSRRRASRAAVLLTTAALAAGGVLVAPVSHAAGFADAELEVSTDASGEQVGTGTDCVVTGTPLQQNLNLVPNQRSVEPLSGSLTVTDPDVASDTARYRFGGRAEGRVTTAGGKPSGVFATARHTVSAEFSKGGDTTCQSSGTASSGTSALFTLNRTQLVTYSVGATGDTRGFVTVQNAAGDLLIDGSSFDGRRSAIFLAPRGQYVVAVDFETTLVSPASQEYDDVAGGTGSFALTMQTPGAATTATQGTGKAYVQLPGTRGCGDGSLAVRLTQKAKQLKRVTYYANGRRAGFSDAPKPGYSIRYNLPAAKPVTFKVVAQPKQGKAVSVTRRYLACTP